MQYNCVGLQLVIRNSFAILAVFQLSPTFLMPFAAHIDSSPSRPALSNFFQKMIKKCTAKFRIPCLHPIHK